MIHSDIKNWILSFQVFTPEHLIYETGDDDMVLYFSGVRNGKLYHAKQILSFRDLNQFLSVLQSFHYDIEESLSESLFNNQAPISDYHFNNINLGANTMSIAA